MPPSLPRSRGIGGGSIRVGDAHCRVTGARVILYLSCFEERIEMEEKHGKKYALYKVEDFRKEGLEILGYDFLLPYTWQKSRWAKLGIAHT